MTRQVFLNSNDISEFVTAIPPIKNEQGQPGQVIVNDIQTITGANSQGFWDTLSTGSPFNQQDLADFKIEIFDDTGVSYFNGIIKDIISDASGRTSQIKIKSQLQIALERGCIYVSEEPESPAQAARNILELYNIPIESGSFSRSSNVYTDSSIQVVCRLFNPEMSVLQALQSLADIGVASISSTAGVVRFDAYRQRAGLAGYTFTDDIANIDGVTLWSQPNVSSLEKTKVDGYNIDTAIAPAITGLNLQQGKSIQAGNEAPITLTSQQAGVGVGELWIEYSNRSQQFVEWTTKIEIGRELLIGYPVDLNYSSRDWSTITVDIVSIDNSSQVFSRLKGVTR